MGSVYYRKYACWLPFYDDPNIHIDNLKTYLSTKRVYKMGAWGTNIKDNDTSADIYADFFDLYNEGQNPTNISAKLIADNKELIDNIDDSNNFWFALALGTMGNKIFGLKSF